MVSFDLDKFKQINDTYGHPAGDQVLKEFAARLSSAIRLSDFAARMGGDEFLILLPECTTSQVPILLDRLRPMEIEYAGRKFPSVSRRGGSDTNTAKPRNIFWSAPTARCMRKSG